MVKKQTIRILEMKRELLMIRARPEDVRSLCPLCNKDVRMLTTDQAAIAAGLGSRAIWREVEAGRLHTKETSEGLLRICLVSLVILYS